VCAEVRVDGGKGGFEAWDESLRGIRACFFDGEIDMGWFTTEREVRKRERRVTFHVSYLAYE